MGNDNELHRLIGRLEGKVDNNNTMLSFLKEKIGIIDNNINKNTDDITKIKQVQAKHKVIIMAMTTILSAVFCEIAVHMLK